jgi:N-acetylmuramoyl-L-alanine amidase
MAVIVIDPGHGGNSVVGHSSPNNATGPAGTKEKNLTLEIAVRVGDALNGSGHTVLLTRKDSVGWLLGIIGRADSGRARASNRGGCQ